MECKGENIEKYISFGHISWEYLGQPMNFLANPYIHTHIYIVQ